MSETAREKDPNESMSEYLAETDPIGIAVGSTMWGNLKLTLGENPDHWVGAVKVIISMISASQNVSTLGPLLGLDSAVIMQKIGERIMYMIIAAQDDEMFAVACTKVTKELRGLIIANGGTPDA